MRFVTVIGIFFKRAVSRLDAASRLKRITFSQAL